MKKKKTASAIPHCGDNHLEEAYAVSDDDFEKVGHDEFDKKKQVTMMEEKKN